jgi:Fe-coproporphyrin III synthase
MKADPRLVYDFLKNWSAYLWGVGRPVPIGYVIIGVTYRCNARCGMCDIHDFYRADPGRVKDEIDFSLLLRRLRESRLISAIRHIDLTGGEPFLCEGLAGLVAGIFAMPRINLVTMNTNGLCTDKIFSDCETILRMAGRGKVFSLSVSIDGIGPLHDSIRGVAGAFARVEDTIARLKELRKQYPHFRIRSNAVIQKENIGALDAIKQYWERNDIDGAFSVVQNPFYTGQSAAGQQGGGFSREDLLKIKAARPKSAGMDYYLEHGFRRPLHCFAGYAALFIDQFGSVYPCNFLARNEAYVMGDIKDSPLDEIWRSSAAREVRAKIRQCPYTCCWNGCEVEQTMVQYGGMEKIVRALSLGRLSYFRLRGLKEFK